VACCYFYIETLTLCKTFFLLKYENYLFIVFPCDLFFQAKEFTTKMHATNSTELIFDQVYTSFVPACMCIIF